MLADHLHTSHGESARDCRVRNHRHGTRNMGGRMSSQTAFRISSKLAVLLVSLTMAGCFSLGQDSERLKEVKRIWTAFPIYPGMVEVNSSTASGFGKAYISKSFQCNASYEDVKRFYVERMSQAGWKLSGERHLKDWEVDVGGRELQFRKDSYQVTLDYAGERADYGWNYAIGIGWMRD